MATESIIQALRPIRDSFAFIRDGQLNYVESDVLKTFTLPDDIRVEHFVSLDDRYVLLSNQQLYCYSASSDDTDFKLLANIDLEVTRMMEWGTELIGGLLLILSSEGYLYVLNVIGGGFRISILSIDITDLCNSVVTGIDNNGTRTPQFIYAKKSNGTTVRLSYDFTDDQSYSFSETEVEHFPLYQDSNWNFGITVTQDGDKSICRLVTIPNETIIELENVLQAGFFDTNYFFTIAENQAKVYCLDKPVRRVRFSSDEFVEMLFFDSGVAKKSFLYLWDPQGQLYQVLNHSDKDCFDLKLIERA